jgi:hypothetical protein
MRLMVVLSLLINVAVLKPRDVLSFKLDVWQGRDDHVADAVHLLFSVLTLTQ